MDSKNLEERVLLNSVRDFAVVASTAFASIPFAFISFVSLSLLDNPPYLHQRKVIGKNGENIIIYKFRTLHPDSEPNYVPGQKQDDPRQTKVGKWLRILKWDEIPQLYNVLKRELNVFGYRPFDEEQLQRARTLLGEDVDKYILKTTPGLVAYPQGLSLLYPECPEREELYFRNVRDYCRYRLEHPFKSHLKDYKDMFLISAAIFLSLKTAVAKKQMDYEKKSVQFLRKRLLA